MKIAIIFPEPHLFFWIIRKTWNHTVHLDIITFDQNWLNNFYMNLFYPWMRLRLINSDIIFQDGWRMIQEVKTKNPLSILSHSGLKLISWDTREGIICGNKNGGIICLTNLVTQFWILFQVMRKFFESPLQKSNLLLYKLLCYFTWTLLPTQRCSYREFAIITRGLSIRCTIPFWTGMLALTILASTVPLLCFLVPVIVLDSTTGPWIKNSDYGQKMQTV